jgi:hypothetical protein
MYVVVRRAHEWLWGICSVAGERETRIRSRFFSNLLPCFFLGCWIVLLDGLTAIARDWRICNTSAYVIEI